MKKKNIDLEYYVFNLDHDDRLYRANILNQDLIDRIYKDVKSGRVKTFEELRHELHCHFLMYWSRIQFEYMVSGVFQNMKSLMQRENRNYPVGKKVDVFYQIEKNLNIITEYIIRKMELPIEIPVHYPEDKDFWEKGNVINENLIF